MKRFIIAVFVILFTFTGVNFSYSGSIVNNPVENSGSLYATGSAQTSYTYEDNYIYVRVFIDGHWWTYVYDQDGSFIVAIPDEDE